MKKEPTHDAILKFMEGPDLMGDGVVSRAVEAHNKYQRSRRGFATAGGDDGPQGQFDYWLVRQCMIEAS